MGDLSFPDVSWKDKTAQKKQPRRFLEYMEDKLIREPTRAGASLDLLFTEKN